MEQNIIEKFRTWGIKQYNSDGKLFEKKSISNYHSSLNTILGKLDMIKTSGYNTIYDCTDVDAFDKLYFEIFNHPEFRECNIKFNYTHSSALKLYKRFVRYWEALQKGPISDLDFKSRENEERGLAKQLSDEELRQKIKKKSSCIPKERTVVSTGYSRDQEVVEYAIRRANGYCDLCLEIAPFHKKDDTPYLEAHHVEWLSRGGEDSIDNVVALCPNCHRKIHVLDEKADGDKLRTRLQMYKKHLPNKLESK